MKVNVFGKNKKAELELTVAKYVKKVKEQNEEIRRLNRQIEALKQSLKIFDAYLIYAFDKIAVPVPVGVDLAPDGSKREDGDKYLDIRLDEIDGMLGKELCVLHKEERRENSARIYIREPKEPDDKAGER